MTVDRLQKLDLKIDGMHCANCAVRVERGFKTIPGVERVRADHVAGKARLYYSSEPKLADLRDAVQAEGYGVSHGSAHASEAPKAQVEETKPDHLEIGAIFLLIVSGYLVLKRLHLAPSLAITDKMSYGFVFLIGLVAAVSSCLAVTGGLLLAVAAKYNERFPNLSGFRKLKPNLYFNAGRLISYTVLGGAVGALGSALTLSTRVTGLVSIAASVVMVVLGFQMLKLFPWLRRLQPILPKVLAHKIHDLSVQDSKLAPLLLGASTFFLPCGFTQALQLYVLSKGDAATGALTMLVFALGTLPALISLSVVSSFAKGAFQGYFVKFAGVLVILVGLSNVSNGLALTGSGVNLASILSPFGASAAAQTEGPVRVVGGKQLIDMKVAGLDYAPSTFTVAQGVPVEWHIDGSQAEGCAQVLTIPSLGIVKYLSHDAPTVVTFVPSETGSIEFSCPMGMTTGGAAFKVVPNSQGIVAAKVAEPPSDAPASCDPARAACAPAQKVSLTISEAGSFSPPVATAKRGVPVELTINNSIPPEGCMAVWLIPKYNVTIPMKIGTVTANFTPTEAGPVPITCSMGSIMAEIDVAG
jgi:sulfite exporter TauE/SafE/copper chaperone CopZ